MACSGTADSLMLRRESASTPSSGWPALPPGGLRGCLAPASQFEGKSRLFSSAGRAPSGQRESVATLQRLQEGHRARLEVLGLQRLHVQPQADRACVLLGQLLGGASPRRKPSRGLGGGADGPAQLGRTDEPRGPRTSRARAKTHRTYRVLGEDGARHIRRSPDRSESSQGLHSSAIGIQHVGPGALTSVGHRSPCVRRSDQEHLTRGSDDGSRSRYPGGVIAARDFSSAARWATRLLRQQRQFLVSETFAELAARIAATR